MLFVREEMNFDSVMQLLQTGPGLMQLLLGILSLLLGVLLPAAPSALVSASSRAL
jgi:hypothetical protein